MATRPPTDEFDRLVQTSRVGAHRAPRSAGQKWIPWLWIILGAALCSVILILSLVIDINNLLIPSVSDSTPTPTAPPVEPTVDASATVAILDGTSIDDLGETAHQSLAAAGWSVTEVSNADTDTVQRTEVVYTDPALEGAAKGLAQDVGTQDILFDDATYSVLGTGLVVVLGADYAPPAS